MIFSRNLPTLKKAHAFLSHLDAPPLPGSLVLEGLEHIMSCLEQFDKAIASGHLFTKHFLRSLTRPALDDQGCWLELFEDIALIVREKTLRPPHEGIAPVEQRILCYFETCGEWHPHDGTQVSTWYWYQLPSLVKRAVTPNQSPESDENFFSDFAPEAKKNA